MAIAVLLLLQVPPEVASVKVAVVPAQRVLTPLMADTDGRELTVRVLVATAVPQLLVTE